MKPLSNRELFWVIVGILIISALGTFGSGAPWWVFPVFVIACCLGCRETLWATLLDREE